jgi:hypothetical protein
VTVDDEAHSFARQPYGNAFANPPAGTGDERHLALKLRIPGLKCVVSFGYIHQKRGPSIPATPDKTGVHKSIRPQPSAKRKQPRKLVRQKATKFSGRGTICADAY